jgi:hypothetical protein
MAKTQEGDGAMAEMKSIVAIVSAVQSGSWEFMERLAATNSEGLPPKSQLLHAYIHHNPKLAAALELLLFTHPA